VVDISFGLPIASTGKRPEELMREAAEWIEAEMRRIDPDAYATSDASGAVVEMVEATDSLTAGAAADAPLASPSSSPPEWERTAR
jgi:1-acyl-sn-glycerol-3-phosphate acyltransferase